MKTLRLFINNDLQSPINWTMTEDDISFESGSSTFAELSMFEDANLEVYLSSTSCSILKTTATGISMKRLTEELVLGLIEESLVDDIDEVKPIILRVEDNTVYVAIFNREFFTKLIKEITDLNKHIRFIQSFVYATIYKEDSWTVFLSKQQRFLRTSRYEYYSLDDNEPLPSLLEDMLLDHKPKTLHVYADEKSGYDIKYLAQKFEVECIDVSNQYKYGIPVWNFYKERSSSFKIKLDHNVKIQLQQLAKIVKVLLTVVVGVWLINITTLGISNYKTKLQIKHDLKNILNVSEVSINSINSVNDKINALDHQRGLYNSSDFVAIFAQFLEIVSVTTPNDIKKVSYEQNKVQIFMRSSFNVSQFSGYVDILKTKRIIATIESYQGYIKRSKLSNQSGTADNELKQSDNEMLMDAEWVITLHPATLNELIQNK